MNTQVKTLENAVMNTQMNTQMSSYTLTGAEPATAYFNEEYQEEYEKFKKVRWPLSQYIAQNVKNLTTNRGLQREIKVCILGFAQPNKPPPRTLNIHFCQKDDFDNDFSVYEGMGWTMKEYKNYHPGH